MKTLGVILAGGQGKRMGNRDKGAISFKGSPLINHVFDRLAPQVDQTIIAGSKDYNLGIPAIKDPIEGYQGPLMGIYAALLWNEGQTIPADVLITAPVDCPYTPKNLCQMLIGDNPTLSHKPKYLIEGKQMQPTFALWPRTCVADLKTALLSDDVRSMKWWIARIEATEIPYDGPEPLVNFNYPEDMA